MKPYEIVLTFPGTLTEEEGAAKLNEVSTLLSTQGAQVLTLNNLGKHRLAYEVDGLRFGWFVHGTMELEPAAVAELEQMLKRHPSVIRLMIRMAKRDVKRSFAFITSMSHERTDKTATHHSGHYTQRVEVAKPVDMAELDKKLDDIIAKGDTVPETL